MILINRTKEAIIANVFNETFNVPFNEQLYNELSTLEARIASETSMDNVRAIRDEAIALLTNAKKSDITAINDWLVEDEATGNVYLVGSSGTRSSVPLPQALVERIKEADSAGLSTEPLVKFWTRLLRNPNIRDSEQATQFANLLVDYVFKTFVSPKLKKQLMDEGFSEEIATERATVFQTPITMEGLISTKKVVTILEELQKFKYVLDSEGNPKRVLREDYEKVIDEDTGEVTIQLADSVVQYSEDFTFEPYVMGTRGDAFRCGDQTETHIIKVGQEMALDNWDQVNCDNNQACVKGLHAGNQDYINIYENDSNATLNCFVDPAMVGAVSCGEHVLRVKALFPHSVKDRETENKQFYHSSHYAKMKDAEWIEERDAAAARFAAELEEIRAQIQQEVDELNDL